ncbi:hypothetical protein HHI36_008753 [Cryptolaemus montrouzieri]|uniref:Uncharacterized protein n=1 Tax=Cryptolaemus montrouzieri TaxID=559131 RepID=A0ABD2MTH9_9CUCU
MINKVINHNPEPIFNVYQRPNGYYWLKVIFMFCILYLRQAIHKIKLSLKNKETLEKYYSELEKTHKLSNHNQPIDAVYFNAANETGEHLVVGTARRKNGLIDGFMYVKIRDNEIGLLESSKLPDTSLYQKTVEEKYGAEGLEIQCVEPMKKWKITYRGKMKKYSDPKQCFDVDLLVMYTSELPFFNFDTDMDPWCMAKCIALEKWSSEYFKLLKQHHQTHYEQHGNIKGNILIDGKVFPINMESMRDHTFGNHREWRNLHKYNLQMFTTENGDRFTVGDVCFPLTVSSFKMGYVYSAADKKIYPITYNDFQLYQHGESGKPPQDYAFTIEAGGKTYIVKVDVIDSPHFFISKDWECKVYERLCTFKVNGLKGWGASEWQQRNILGKNILGTQNASSTSLNIQKSTEVSNVRKIPAVRRLVGVKSTELFETMLKK